MKDGLEDIVIFNIFCRCASDSLCAGILTNNRSICICPLNKFGLRCILTDTICQMNNNNNNNNSICQNGDQCISNFDYVQSGRKITCICQKGYSGE